MPTFQLERLGWNAFEQLCGTVMREVLGQTVQQFAEGSDQGRDAAFHGRWQQSGSEGMSGSFAVQCKHRSLAGTLSLADVRPELPKIRQLHAQGDCDNYILMTNARVTSASEARIREAVREVGPSGCLVIAGNQIDAYLRENRRLRTLVPRMYGLGDLSEILDERAYAQAEAILQSMREDISKFVVTEPYRQSVERLNDHGFVLLLGEPMAGKSMIAAALAMDALDLWECRTTRTDSAGLFRTHWNPHEPGQFMWVDDAFGTTQYQLRLADEWNRILPLMRAAISKGTRVVMTSRDYIWESAKYDLKLSEFEPLLANQVLVEVRDLTIADREQILYNHLRLGDQPTSFKSQVKPFLDEVAAVDPFLPEVARRFSTSRFTVNLAPTRIAVNRFFSHPIEHLTSVVEQLSDDERAAIAVVYMAGGSREAPFIATDLEETAIRVLGSTVGGVINGLRALDGSLLVRTHGPTRDEWSYKHPTIGEAFAKSVVDRPELMPVYLSGMSDQSLLGEVRCGMADDQRGLLVAPAHYSIVLRKLAGMPGHLRPSIESFLVSRCDDAFIKLLVEHDPEFLEDGISTGSIRLAARLLRAGVLKEEARLQLVEDLRDLFLENLDGGSASFAYEAGVVYETEFQEIMAAAVQFVLPDLDDAVWALASNYDGSSDIDDWMEEIGRTIGVFRDYAELDSGTERLIVQAEEAWSDAKRELEEEYPGEPDFDDDDRIRTTPISSVPSGSIFSDVDQ